MAPNRPPRKRKRVLELHWKPVTRDQLHSPIGTWNADSGIAALIESGRLKISLKSLQPRSIELYALVRSHLIGAAKAAYDAARVDELLNKSRSILQSENEDLLALRTTLLDFISRGRKETELLRSAELPKEQIDRLPDQRVYALGALFAANLAQLIGRRQRIIVSASSPNTDHLAQRYVQEMKFFWRFITERDPPKTGGQILIQLAADTWRDRDFPVSATQELEDWLAERFKTSARVGSD